MKIITQTWGCIWGIWEVVSCVGLTMVGGCRGCDVSGGWRGCDVNGGWRGWEVKGGCPIKLAVLFGADIGTWTTFAWAIVGWAIVVCT